MVAAGPDSRLLRAALEPWCPVPFVAWPNPGLPGWAGSLDLVVVLAPDGSDSGTASGVAEAVRRGCQVVVACPPSSMVAEHAAGRYSTILPIATRDQLATAVVVLSYLGRVQLGPEADAEQVAEALDEVAIACSPHRDLAVNPAKMLAIALAGDAEHLLPVIEAARERDVFDDPFSDAQPERRPMLLLLDDDSEEPVVREQRGRLLAAASSRGVRMETVRSDAPSEVARYASLLLSGTYSAEYLRAGLVEE